MPETFTDYLARQLGTDKWALAPRLTKRLRESGYTVAVSQAAYKAHEREWDRQTYGAPLGPLREAAPDLLAALEAACHRLAIARTGYPYTLNDPPDEDTAEARGRALIARVKGEATPASRPAAE